MPQSRTRTKHPHHHSPATRRSAVRKRSAALVVAILAAILGLLVAMFTQSADVWWIVIDTAAGATIGYLVGRSMDKSIIKSEHS